MKSLSIREKAISYRKQGYSYNMIAERLSLAKSTLSVWLKDINFVPNEQVIARIQFAKRKLIIAAQKRGLKARKSREEIERKAEGEIKRIDRENLWHIGTILYLCEGAKKQRQIQIANSDPRVIKIAMKWLTNICKVSIDDIRAGIHIYPDINENKAIKFWSKITKLPKSQFQKTMIDRRIKKLKIRHGLLPYGTLHLRVRRGGILFSKISGWINGILEKLS